MARRFFYSLLLISLLHSASDARAQSLHTLPFVDRIRVLVAKNTGKAAIDERLNTIDDFLELVPKLTLQSSVVLADGSIRMAPANGSYFLRVSNDGLRVAILDTRSVIHPPVSYSLSFEASLPALSAVKSDLPGTRRVHEGASFFLPQPLEASLAQVSALDWSSSPLSVLRKRLDLYESERRARARPGFGMRPRKTAVTEPNPAQDFTNVLKARNTRLFYAFLQQQPGFDAWFAKRMRTTVSFQAPLAALLAGRSAKRAVVALYPSVIEPFFKERGLSIDLDSLDVDFELLPYYAFLREQFTEVLYADLGKAELTRKLREQLNRMRPFAAFVDGYETDVRDMKETVGYRIENWKRFDPKLKARSVRCANQLRSNGA